MGKEKLVTFSFWGENGLIITAPVACASSEKHSKLQDKVGIVDQATFEIILEPVLFFSFFTLES